MANFLMQAKDAMVSLVNNMGKQGKDKSASTVYVMPVMTDADLLIAYRSSWLARKVVNIPAFDMFRRWRDWQVTEGDIGDIESEEKRLRLQGKMLSAMVQARLFGGAALYIGTGESDTSQPLDPERIQKGGIRFINILRKRELQAGELERDPESELYGTPKFYTLSAADKQGVVIHPSRLVIFKGDEIPDDELLPMQMGWGDSVLQTVMESIRQSDSTMANIAALVFEAKVDVVKVPDLMVNLASADYESRLLQRFQLASVAKGINSVLLLDKEEEYESKAAAFAQLPEIAQTFFQSVSGASDIPLTRLLGQSPGGMNATGESDLRNYYDGIQAKQNVTINPAINILNECLIRSATGGRNSDTHYIWASLWQLSDKERSEIGKTIAETVSSLHNTGLFPPEALANSAANALVEASVMPGLIDEIDEAGGLPDYEAEAEAEAEMQQAQLAAKAKAPTVDTQIDMFTDGNMKSLYVRRDVINPIAIRKHYEAQGLEVTVKSLHVTVIYSRTPVDWFAIGEAWDDEIKLRGGARDHAFFGPPGLENSLVLMIKCRQLDWRHEQFKEIGAESSYATYQAHISLQYKKDGDILLEKGDLTKYEPYTGMIELGPEIFEEVK